MTRDWERHHRKVDRVEREKERVAAGAEMYCMYTAYGGMLARQALLAYGVPQARAE